MGDISNHCEQPYFPILPVNWEAAERGSAKRSVTLGSFVCCGGGTIHEVTQGKQIAYATEKTRQNIFTG
jgi:hypothetical protein